MEWLNFDRSMNTISIDAYVSACYVHLPRWEPDPGTVDKGG